MTHSEDHQAERNETIDFNVILNSNRSNVFSQAQKVMFIKHAAGFPSEFSSLRCSI